MTVALAVFVGISAVSLPSASAAPLCALNSAAHSLAITAQPSARVTIAAKAPYLTVNDVACALLTEVNSVSIDMAPSPSSLLIFDLHPGPLGPGFTDEGNGSSEIEFQISGMTSATDVDVSGSPAGDWLRAGQFLNKITGVVTGQLNLNGFVDGATQDVDVSFTSFPGRVELFGSDGNDTLSGTGVGVFQTGAYGGSMRELDGLGADQLVGGSGNDQISTDNLAGDTGNTFSGGPGTDTFSTGGSSGENAAIRLDGVANDGLDCPGGACAGNNVAGDFEILRGSVSDDYIVGDADAEVISGEGGIDIIKGLGGNDTLRNLTDDRFPGRPNALYGGPGDDQLFGSAGTADTFQGGRGVDTVSFGALPSGVVVTLDGLPNDGTAGMDADVGDDIERIIGSAFEDTLTGNEGDNTLLGGPGPDHLFGLEGNDTLSGQGGGDGLDGGPGTDTCTQGAGSGTKVNCEA
jgi:Ca2+-binding RTX toxin-like protein